MPAPIIAHWLDDPKPEGVGFHYLDHLTHNVFRGNMDKWFEFYAELFNFQEIRFFDIEGKFTGLFSRALTSPCGRIRIPINEDRGEKGQIVAYLHKYKGEGIQHIAVGSDRLYDATDTIYENGVRLMPSPPDAYYEMSKERVTDHSEPLDRMQKHGILIDGEGILDGAKLKFCCRFFQKQSLARSSLSSFKGKGTMGLERVILRPCLKLSNKSKLKVGSFRIEYYPVGSSRVMFCPRFM